MLLEFQQALADLVASPDFCRQVRADPEVLMRRYDGGRDWKKDQALALAR